MSDQYVIFWLRNSRTSGNEHFVTYPTLEEAQEELRSFRFANPRTLYRIARILEEEPAIADGPIIPSLRSTAGAL